MMVGGRGEGREEQRREKTIITIFFWHKPLFNTRLTASTNRNK